VTDFGAEVTFTAVADQASLRDARRDVEDELADMEVQVDAVVDQGQPGAGARRSQGEDGGSGKTDVAMLEVQRRTLAAQQDSADFDEERNEILETISDHLEESEESGGDDKLGAIHDLAVERNDLLRELIDETERGNRIRARGGNLGGAAGGALGLLVASGAVVGLAGLAEALSDFNPDIPSLPDEIPVNVPDEIPVNAPDEIPVNAPNEIPVNAPNSIPVSAPDLPSINVPDLPTPVPPTDPTDGPGDSPTPTPTPTPDPNDLPGGSSNPDNIPVPRDAPGGTGTDLPTPTPTPTPTDEPFPPIEEFELPEEAPATREQDFVVGSATKAVAGAGAASGGIGLGLGSGLIGSGAGATPSASGVGVPALPGLLSRSSFGRGLLREPLTDDDASDNRATTNRRETKVEIQVDARDSRGTQGVVEDVKRELDELKRRLRDVEQTGRRY